VTPLASFNLKNVLAEKMTSFKSLSRLSCRILDKRGSSCDSQSITTYNNKPAKARRQDDLTKPLMM